MAGYVMYPGLMLMIIGFVAHIVDFGPRWVGVLLIIIGMLAIFVPLTHGLLKDAAISVITSGNER